MEKIVLEPRGYIQMSASPESVRFWVKFLANVWLEAANNGGLVHPCLSWSNEHDKENLAAWERCDAKIESARSAEEYGAALAALKEYIDRCEGEEAPQIDTHFSAASLSAGWNGTATEGRFVSVELTGDTLVVRWDTATERESDFLGLPSTAQSFMAGNRTYDFRIQTENAKPGGY